MKKVRNKSRKKKAPQQDGFLFIGPAAVILLLVAAVSLTYLHFHNQCDMLGKDIRDLEVELERVQGRALVEQSRWSSMITLEGVIMAVERHGLDMAWPHRSRIVEVGSHRGTQQYAMGSNSQVWGGRAVHD